MCVYLQLEAQLLLNALPLDTAGDDCPVFDGLFDYCAISAGGSMGGRLPNDLKKVCADSSATRGGGKAKPGQMRYCNQLGWWFAPCKEIRGERVLLCERWVWSFFCKLCLYLFFWVF